MKVLVLGSTGMLGQSLMKEACLRRHEPIGVARKNADICIDITDDISLKRVLIEYRPDIVINTVAVVNHDECERNPGYAYLVNSRPISILTDICADIGARFVHISTDHYYTDDKDKRHDEQHPVKILNEYARTKYAAETFAMLAKDVLVVRTNIVGYRNKKDQLTFFEWVIKSVKADAQLTLFEDYYTSSINVTQLAGLLFDLISKRAIGIINLACRETRSKKDFVETVARKLNIHLSNVKIGTVLDLEGTPRAESLGLDVTLAENILGYKLPDFDQVVSSLVAEYYSRGQSL